MAPSYGKISRTQSPRRIPMSVGRPDLDEFAAGKIETLGDKLKRYLIHRLKDGPQNCDSIRKEMLRLGYYENTIQRAMRDLGIERCYWLPEQGRKP
jgi:hypothetical protein